MDIYGEEMLVGGAAVVLDWKPNHAKLQLINSDYAKYWAEVKAKKAELSPDYFKRASGLLVRWDRFFKPLNVRRVPWTEDQATSLELYATELEQFKKALEKSNVRESPAMPAATMDPKKRRFAMIAGSVAVVGLGAYALSGKRRR